MTVVEDRRLILPAGPYTQQTSGAADHIEVQGIKGLLPAAGVGDGAARAGVQARRSWGSTDVVIHHGATPGRRRTNLLGRRLPQ